MPTFVDLTNKKFGDLLIVLHAGKLDGFHRWVCRCDCGRFVIRTSGQFAKNALERFPPNCGCLGKKKRLLATTRHGYTTKFSMKSEYASYYSMLARCTKPENPGYGNYGGRGISVCDRWRFGEDGKRGFICFLEDLGPKPTKDYSIERVNVNGNYEPSNVIWIPKIQQPFNTTRTVSVTVAGEKMHATAALEKVGISHTKFFYWKKRGYTAQQVIDGHLSGEIAKKVRLLTFKGETMSLTAWAKKLQIDKVTLTKRLDALGWNVERALSTPVQAHKIQRGSRAAYKQIMLRSV